MIDGWKEVLKVLFWPDPPCRILVPPAPPPPLPLAAYKGWSPVPQDGESIRAGISGSKWITKYYTGSNGNAYILSSSNISEEQNMSSVKLPTGNDERKDIPIATGCLDYFPDALAAIAALSKIGNDKHNPGEPLHWSRGKSNDHPDCLIRHFLERGTIDAASGENKVRHSTQMAWRALAILQLELEKIASENEAHLKPMTASEIMSWRGTSFAKVPDTIAEYNAMAKAQQEAIDIGKDLPYAKPSVDKPTDAVGDRRISDERRGKLPKRRRYVGPFRRNRGVVRRKHNSYAPKVGGSRSE